MRASMYFNYTTRSLLRGGQRTILAVFCVAVGVMAIVSLQLVGYMLHYSLTANTRAINGGDIALSARNTPLKESDLLFFEQLKHDGTITDYSALSSIQTSLTTNSTAFTAFPVEAVVPDHFPLVSSPTFVNPGNGSLADLLRQDQVVVTQRFSDTSGKKVGDRLTLYGRSQTGNGLTLSVKIAGVIANDGAFAQAANLVLISFHDFQNMNTANTVSYNAVDITTSDQAHTDKALKAISHQFPLVTLQTVADVQRSVKSSFDIVNKFLEIAGLLALLIGGVGIVNTMRVFLARRKTEIAMLKTAGYKRFDLYLLFGLEAGLLGLAGGCIGAVTAIGVSYLVRGLLQNLGVVIIFQLDPWIVINGVVIGCATALIFGLLPIVKAASIRPLNVIRDLGENHGLSSHLTTIFLLAVLSVLFCILAIVILNNDVTLGIETVYGTFIFLLLLSGLLSLLVLAVSKLPVPARFDLKQLLYLSVSGVLAGLAYQILPAFGILLGCATVLGIVVIILPRSWKVSTKMALRNIGRQRGRTTTTVLALFIGVFAIGLVLTLVQSLQSLLQDTFTKQFPYNITVVTTGTETKALAAQKTVISGLIRSREDSLLTVSPSKLNGQSLQDALPADNRQGILGLLNTLEGYDLIQSQPDVTLDQGRNLEASDANTSNVLISAQLSDTGPFHTHLKPGDTLTLVSADGQSQQSVTIVGTYSGDINLGHIGNILASNRLLNMLLPHADAVSTVTYMKVETAQVNKALAQIGTIAPHATTQSVADIVSVFETQLNSMMYVLVAIASLSLLAGIIIIANSVALAMLERRREMGILKSVGYTSISILREVGIENGMVGAISAFSAMLLASGAVVALGRLAFNVTPSMPLWIVLSMVSGTALLVVFIATLISYKAVRIRPLEVLRYE